MEKNKPDAFQFKAVTKGLGFKPFSQGLPYAPHSPKKGLSMGSGAVSAGQPVFHFPKKTLETPQAESSSEKEAKETRTGQSFGFLYVFKRMMAYLFDTTLNTLICVGGLSFVIFQLNLKFTQILGPESLLLLGAFLFAFNWALITAEEVSFGTTLGKKAFGLHLEGSGFSLLLRSFAFLLSLVLGGLGLLVALLNKNKRCLHDFISGKQPIEVARLST